MSDGNDTDYDNDDGCMRLTTALTVLLAVVMVVKVHIDVYLK